MKWYAPCADVALDFTEITEGSPEAWIQRARRTCAACPARVDHCLPFVMRHHVAGFAAGMFESERSRGIPAQSSDLDLKRSRLDGDEVARVIELTARKFTAREIAQTLPGMNPRRVAYIRRWERERSAQTAGSDH